MRFVPMIMVALCLLPLSSCALFESPNESFVLGVEERLTDIEPFIQENLNNTRTKPYTEAQVATWNYWVKDFHEFIDTAKRANEE